MMIDIIVLSHHSSGIPTVMVFAVMMFYHGVTSAISALLVWGILYFFKKTTINFFNIFLPAFLPAALGLIVVFYLVGLDELNLNIVFYSYWFVLAIGLSFGTWLSLKKLKNVEQL